MDIIIFGGQSNMQGQSEALISTEIVPNSYEYKYLTDEISEGRKYYLSSAVKII